MYTLEFDETIFESDQEDGGEFVAITDKISGGVKGKKVFVPIEDIVLFVVDYLHQKTINRSKK